MLNQKIKQFLYSQQTKENSVLFNVNKDTTDLINLILKDAHNQERFIEKEFNFKKNVIPFNICGEDYDVEYVLYTFERDPDYKYDLYGKTDVFKKTLSLHIKLKNGLPTTETVNDIVKKEIEFIYKYQEIKNKCYKNHKLINAHYKASEDLDSADWKTKIFKNAIYILPEFIQVGLVKNHYDFLASTMYESYITYRNVLSDVENSTLCRYYQDMVYALNLLNDYDEKKFALSKRVFKNMLLEQIEKFAEKINKLKNDLTPIYHEKIENTHFHVPYHFSHRFKEATKEDKKRALQLLMFFAYKQKDHIISKDKVYLLLWLADRLQMRTTGERMLDVDYLIVGDKIAHEYVNDLLVKSKQDVFIDLYNDSDKIDFLIVNKKDEIEALHDYNLKMFQKSHIETLEKVNEHFNGWSVDDLIKYCHQFPEWQNKTITTSWPITRSSDEISVMYFFEDENIDEFFKSDKETLESMKQKYVEAEKEKHSFSFNL